MQLAQRRVSPCWLLPKTKLRNSCHSMIELTDKSVSDGLGKHKAPRTPRKTGSCQRTQVGSLSSVTVVPFSVRAQRQS
ncbi:hypothetical protein BCR37DRAFT_383543 [Protomyces lactucae-debilis]|uniref:Uncharacterized protein n=1 Tax=Protomyces lactucae-debilis TaxID=2754530 RepID=A0A1Y2EXU7_PROLT|nr:uncharacterized protein BCR37DRAFT_383543 [Protomyces lactucae-debilis]ORY76400.1 hypothetical protein BCR37DRAFT_383543 [Protomyces lactucae-debilis]